MLAKFLENRLDSSFWIYCDELSLLSIKFNYLHGFSLES